jgi:hypothetical protein
MVKQQQVPTMSFDEMAHNLKFRIALTSKKFVKWPLRHENTKKHIHAIAQNEHFRSLAVHALRMSSSTPRNATHLVKIYLKQGFGLGEIASLERYELVTMQDAIFNAVRK